ncbi:MAG TPA: hypothetical protein VE783_05145 [Candidatus Limnocylindrales bacterium]|nr:hypothetical protein [Candidatus Limnocylindrales bacterium]
MLILFDQGTPVPLRAFLIGHTVKTAAEQEWSTLANGKLMDAAEAAGFEVFVTTDKNLLNEQNLSRRKLAIVVLGNAQWPVLKLHVHLAVAAVNSVKPGSYIEVEIPAP